MTDSLPSFKHPPLNEVVLGTQFEPLTNVDVRHIGLFWAKHKERFPNFQAVPPLDPRIENFSSPITFSQPQVKLEIVAPPTFPRSWLLDSTKCELLQLQRDRLLHNWRKVDGSEKYPRYGHLREQFSQDITQLSDFLSEYKLGDLKPTQCEATYFNHIPVGNKEEGYPDPSTVFTFFSPFTSIEEIANFESAGFTGTTIVKGKDSLGNQVLARMHIEQGSIFNTKTQELAFKLNITVRGVSSTQDKEGVLAFFDFARNRIVRTFVKLTKAKFHKQWGKEK